MCLCLCVGWVACSWLSLREWQVNQNSAGNTLVDDDAIDNHQPTCYLHYDQLFIVIIAALISTMAFFFLGLPTQYYYFPHFYSFYLDLIMLYSGNPVAYTDYSCLLLDHL